LFRKNSLLPKGTIITVRVDNCNASIVSPDPSNWITSKPQPSGQGSFDLNGNGEQIFFMTGGEVGATSATIVTLDTATYSGYFLYGFNTKGNVWTPVCGNSTAGGTENSGKPSDFDYFLV
jgi:hypothetical protein